MPASIYVIHRICLNQHGRQIKPLVLLDRCGWLLRGLGTPWVAQRVWAMPRWTSNSKSRSISFCSKRVKQTQAQIQDGTKGWICYLFLSNNDPSLLTVDFFIKSLDFSTLLDQVDRFGIWLPILAITTINAHTLRRKKKTMYKSFSVKIIDYNAF